MSFRDMNPDRQRQVEQLYRSALERKPGERSAFLARTCQGDEELRRDVESLLETDSSNLSEVTRTPPGPGTELGPYRIEAPLGEGGMGVVYRARDTKLNRPVAIKFLSDDLADTAARRRFQREAQMASSLNHPHILTVHDVGEFQERQYLVTELVDGGTLGDCAKAENRTWRNIAELR